MNRWRWNRAGAVKALVHTAWLQGWFVLAVLGLALSAVQAEAALTVYFDPSGYGGDVWLQVQDPNQNFVATYGGGTSIAFPTNPTRTLMSTPVKLSAIGTGGLSVTSSDSAVFYLYYDDPTGNSLTAAPAYAVSTQRFQPFELTMMGGSGDQGNLTAINYFTAPLSLKSYQNDPHANLSEPVLQQTGYGSNTAVQIGAQLASASGNSANAVIANSAGRAIRYLGPSSITSNNPWPSFLPYLQSINGAGQSTTIQRSNGFNFAAPDNTPVYQFGANMTATVGSDGTITVTGSITATADAAVTSGNPALPVAGYWPNATITFSATDMNALNNAIYGQVVNSAVTSTGTAFSDFLAFTNNTRKNPLLPHDVNTNPSLYDLGAYNTTVAMFIGEVTTGLLGGFFNSNYQVNSVAIKAMPSNSWWSLNPMVAYSTIQTSNPYYNVYANIIYNVSSNTVYGVPYSDRFGSGPLVNSVNYNNTAVGYWVVGLGAPLGATTSTAGPISLLLLN